MRKFMMFLKRPSIGWRIIRTEQMPSAIRLYVEWMTCYIAN